MRSHAARRRPASATREARSARIEDRGDDNGAVRDGIRWEPGRTAPRAGTVARTPGAGIPPLEAGRGGGRGEADRSDDGPEGECRRGKRAGAGVAAGLALGVMGGAALRPAETIEAGEFVLRDREGALRAALTLRPDGTPGLGLFDKAG